MRKLLVIVIGVILIMGISNKSFAYPSSVTVDSFSNGCAEYNFCDSSYASVLSIFFEAGQYEISVDSGAFNSWNVPYGQNLIPPGYFWGLNIYQPSTSTQYLLGDFTPYSTQSAALNAHSGAFITITQPSDGNLLFYVRDDNARDNIGSLTASVAVVPEPLSSSLFIIGGVFFAGRQYWKKRVK